MMTLDEIVGETRQLVRMVEQLPPSSGRTQLELQSVGILHALLQLHPGAGEEGLTLEEKLNIGRLIQEDVEKGTVNPSSRRIWSGSIFKRLGLS